MHGKISQNITSIQYVLQKRRGYLINLNLSSVMPFSCYRSVDCYETCIVGSPFDPTVPFQCCADSVLVSEEISLTIDPSFIIARLYSPNEPDMSIYRLNTYCK